MLRLAAAVLCVTAILLLPASVAVAADSPREIVAKLQSRDSAIHLLDDWMRDPYIVRAADGWFYLSCTRLNNIPGGRQGLEIWRSRDLVSWDNCGVPWTTDDSAWLAAVVADLAETDKPFLLWAPEVHPVGDRWVVLHTSNARRSNLIVNRSPTLVGPFVEPMKDQFGHRHDPSLFVDDDGTPWLIAACAKLTPLKPDFTGVAGPEIVVNPSNRKMGHEGCLIRKIGSKYVLFGTAWSRDQMRRGSYNLYYCTADRVTGPYGPRKFAGRFLGHGTPFQDNDGHWWCTAFLNGECVARDDPVLRDPQIDKAVTINRQGLTIVPLDMRVERGDVVVQALDPAYARPGPEEVQPFDLR